MRTILENNNADDLSSVVFRKSLYQKLRDVYVEALQKQTTCPVC